MTKNLKIKTDINYGAVDDISVETAGVFGVKLHEVNYVLNIFNNNLKKEKIYIFFNAGGRINGELKFHRQSWVSSMDGLCLYIEDPMYAQYPGINVAWFYGDQHRTMLDDIEIIIRKILSVYGIGYENTYLFGSSAGGYAAIYMGNKLKESNVFAYNPQLLIGLWHSSQKFEEMTGLSLHEDDKLGRNNLLKISLNPIKKIVIFFNLASSVDYVQCEKLFNFYGLSPRKGVTALGAFYVICEEIYIKDPHLGVIKSIDYLCLQSLSLNSGWGDHLVEEYAKCYAKRIESEEDYYIKNIYLELINSDLINNGFSISLKQDKNIEIIYFGIIMLIDIRCWERCFWIILDSCCLGEKKLVFALDQLVFSEKIDGLLKNKFNINPEIGLYEFLKEITVR